MRDNIRNPGVKAGAQLQRLIICHSLKYEPFSFKMRLKTVIFAIRVNLC